MNWQDIEAFYSHSHEWTLGDIGIVTTKKGVRFVAIYTPSHIDWFWNPVLGNDDLESSFLDPEVSVEIIGKSGRYEKERLEAEKYKS